MKKSNFLKHFAIISSGTLFNIVLVLLTTPVITRIVNPTEYGKLSLFTMYATIGTMICCFGLDQALVRYYYEQNSMEYKRALVNKCIRIPVVVSSAGGVLWIVLGMSKGNLGPFSFPIIVLLYIFVVIQMLYRFSVLTLRLEYKSKWYACLNTIQKVLYLGSALLALILIKRDHFIILTVSTVLSYMVCLILSFLVQPRIWNIKKWKKDMCNVSTKELLKYAYPFVFSSGLTMLFQTIDRIALNFFCTYNEVGIYASAVEMTNAFQIIQTTFNTLWTPMVMEHYTHDPIDTRFYQKGHRAITVIMFLMGLLLILGKDIFSMILGEKYRQAAYILPCLIFSPVMSTISETTAMGLIFKKKSKMQVAIALGACITNFLGNITLIPILGGKGAAISTGLSYIVFFSLRTMLANRYFYVKHQLGKLYVMIIMVGAFALYNTFIMFNWGTIVGFMICLISLLLLYKEVVQEGIAYVQELVKKVFTDNTIHNT